jgi:hypothetical protein
MYEEQGFPLPLYAKNPKTNIEFSYKQFVSLYYQLKDLGELKWGFTTLKECNFNKKNWYLYHKSLLTINAIKTSIIQLDTIDARELLRDFIFSKMDEFEIDSSTYIINAYKIAMVKWPMHWYIQKFKYIAITYYEAEHFNLNKSNIINAMCRKLFRKQEQFINDLKIKNIIK